ncbi:50S ribosomal protein L25 [Chloroflexota bacterium]
MDTLILAASNRTVLRKKTRFLRRQGITPVHLFGHSIESLALQCDTIELKSVIAQAGMTRAINIKIENQKQAKSVFIREIQRDTVSRDLLHVDFYQIRKGDKIKVDVPIVLIGDAPALKGKGRMLAHGITSLSIECLPESIPSRIEVDLSPLEELEQSIHVRDITLDPEITVNADPDQLIAKVSEVAAARVEEEVAVAEAGVEAEGEAPAEETPEQTPAES